MSSTAHTASPTRSCWRWILLVALLVQGTARAECRSGGGLELLHFNDFHGQLAPLASPDRGGIARLARLLQARRARDPDQAVILLFAGDLLQGTLSSSLFMGIPDVVLFGRIGVDAAVVGNHEFDYGQDVFRRLAERADFPFLSANVIAEPLPLPVRASLLIAKPGAPVVGVLGLTTSELLVTTHPRNTRGLRVEDPIEVARRLVPELREQADMVVVLSHLGLAEDRRLARSVAGIDLIVGGHDHLVLEQPVLEAGVPIVQAGGRGQWLGRMDLRCREGRLEPVGYGLIPIDASQAEDAEIAGEVRRILAQTNAGMDEVIGTTGVELSAEREVIRRGEAVFGDLLADLAREITGADVALFNAGGFRSNVPQGPVTLGQVYEALPFGNELVVGRISGAQIMAALSRSAAMRPMDNPGGFLQVSGVRYEIGGERLRSATIDGSPIESEREYRVVTSDFLAAGGDGYGMLRAMRDPVMTGRLLGDILIEAMRAGETLSPRLDGRILRYED